MKRFNKAFVHGKRVSRFYGATAALVVASLLTFSPHVRAQQMTVNEVYNSSSNDEWVELLVVQDNLDIRGWDLRDFSSIGTAQTPLVFSSSALWSNLRKGTVIVVGTPTTTFTEDTDPSDYLLMIKSNNGLYFTGSVFSFAGSSDAIQIRNASATHIFGVSWGTNNASSLPAPKVHFSGSSTSNTSTSFNEDTTPELTSTSNWSQNVAATQGVGNSITNAGWISTLRAHPDGSGHAIATPDTIVHGNSYTVTLTFYRDTSFSLSDMRVVLPDVFGWSHDLSDVGYTNMTATTSVSGDTIYFNNVTLVDSTIITVANVTAPDSTASYPIVCQTKSVTDYGFTSPTPKIICLGLPSSIADAKVNDVNGLPVRLGQLVTLRGVVTVANEFGSPSYMQDNTGGIGFFDPTVSSLIHPGDEIVLTGTIAPFNGLAELSNLLLQEIASSGNNVDPLVVSATNLKNDGAGGVEQFEGMLVRVNAATVTDTFNVLIPNWTVTGSGTNYRLHDASGYVDLRVDNNVDFANTPAPQSAFDVVGIVGQFKSTSPYIGGYQFMPRSSADILSKGPMFATAPYETNITPTSIRINWATINNGTSRLRYGTSTAYELGVLNPDDVLRTTHAIDINGLAPATIYHVQAFSVHTPDTSLAADLIVSSASPSATTGQMHVYFNKSVVTSLAITQSAAGNENLTNRFLTRVNSATHSIDAAFYSLSGTPGNSIASALISAKNRGVVVRIVCEADNRNSAAFNSIAATGIPVITDAFDLVNAGAGLSHNKFGVIDYNGGAPDSVWVWSGSWNPTDPGTNNDRQNSIEIQDIALAGAYTTEFNEMWGSTTSVPNQSQTRFGARKRDNTPHHFNINGVSVESYFSPSDHTNSHIAKTLGKAQHSVSVSILTFTRKDLADSLISRKNSGKKVCVVIDNNTDTGNQYAYLQSNSVDVHLKGGPSGLLHHKYASIDGDQLTGPQYTITGSHNWSSSAEGSNDENTLIIENNSIANQYLQEFAARYYEAGGTDSLQITSAPLFSVAPASVNFGTVDTSTTKTDSVIVSNLGNAPLSVSIATSSNPVFFVLPDSSVVAPSAQQKFYVTFAPVAAGVQNGSIIFTHNATGSPDTVSVQGTGKVDTVITPSDSASVIYHILAGWNMLSLPVGVDDPRKSALFPSATTKAFAYTGNYVQKDSLVKGVGYWLKFPGGQSDTISGLKMPSETTLVKSGWNIIGPPSKPVPVGSIIQTPSGITISNFYGYNGAYFIEDTLLPGKAYWIKTSQAGTFTLSGSAMVPKVKNSHELSDLNAITVTDAVGISRKLFFGSPSGPFVTDKYEAPPLAPGDGFDLRFGSGRLVEIVAKDDLKAAEYAIALRTPDFPVKIGWTIDSKDNNHYNLRVSAGNGISRIQLSGSGETIVHDELESLTLTVTPQKALPHEYSLGQNYPNPFNPRTTIPFSLPGASTVTLKIYNILGEDVATLLENAEYDAGYFESSFDASLLASGMYMYRLNAVAHDISGTSYHQEKKLLLIK